jgi:hypothetical protein
VLLASAVVSHQVVCCSLTTTASQPAPSFASGVVPCRRCRDRWTVTSGRDGSFQVIYQVPERYWNGIVTRKYKTGITDAEGKPEQVELRWTGCQSVVAGDHPLTPGYRWVAKYSSR